MTSPSIGFRASLSTRRNTQDAIQEVIDLATAELSITPNLGFVFFSPHHAENATTIASKIADCLQDPDQLLGCSGDAIVGPGREVEEEPAMSLWLAALPESHITTMHLEFRHTPEGNAIAGWHDELIGPWPAGSFLLAVGEPFSFPADVMLEQLHEDRPGTRVMGGMASGGHAPGENRLIRGTRVFTEGAVVAHVAGGVRLRPLVSQGCRPIGRPFVVTKAERNLLYELGGRPALEQLRELFQTLPTCEQALVNRGLHLGRVVSEYLDHFEQGDFLVRNVIGGDAASGAIALGDYIRTGQTVQFQIRDAASADAELRQLLSAVRDDPGHGARGALLFTCNGRGTRLFPEANHDAASIAAMLGNLPVAGFFAQGEIGPVGGKNFVHGFTASLAILEELPETDR